MLSILFALVSYVGWGVGDIFGTIASRKLGLFSVTFWSSILTLIIFSAYTPLAFSELQGLTQNLLVLNVVLAIILLVGFLSFNEGLITSTASLVGTIAASFSAVTVVLSIIFLNESITLKQTIAMLVIFTGLILSTLDFNDLRKRRLILNRGVAMALIAMVTWGIYFTFVKLIVREIGWFWPNYISFMVFVPLILLFTKFRNTAIRKPTFKGAMPFLVLTALFLRTAEFSFNFAIDNGLTAVVAPIAGSYPTLFVLLAFLVFKDPITRQQIAGVITTLAGIVLLSFFSV